MRTVLLSNEEIDLLVFLWRWKVSTTALLAAKFYGARPPKQAYARLRALEQGGFIECRADRAGKKFLWCLTKHGFYSMAGYLPSVLRENGYQSEYPGHDLVVAAVQGGDAVLDPVGIECFTEQELRRCHTEHYPSWLPKSDWHRPDGYWQLITSEGNKAIALEVELTEKQIAEYMDIGRFYDNFLRIVKVIWVIERPATAQRILAKFREQKYQTQKHFFFLLEHFLHNGWRARCHLGNPEGVTMAELPQYSPGTSRELVPRLYHLNLRKSPHKAKTSLSYERGDFSH